MARPFRVVYAPSRFATAAPMSAGLFTTVTLRSLERRHLLRGRAGAAGDDRARVAHAPSGRRRLTRDEGDDRLLNDRAIQPAASSSAVPPISPIMTTASVSASFAKSSSASMNVVPISGSPPMPMQVVCPRPRRVS